MPTYDRFCNSVKASMSGEFHETIEVRCHECDGAGIEQGDGECRYCEGEGEVSLKIAVSWTTIKAIYKRAVELFPQPTGRTDSERLDWLESKASMRVSSVYIDSQTSRYTVDNWQTHTDTLRDAIDAAMDSAKGVE